MIEAISYGQSPLQVSFSADVSGMPTIVKYEWDFGDGTASNEANPIHIYFMAGKYTATLKATDEDGNEYTDSWTIRVYDWDLDRTTDEDDDGQTVDSGTHVSVTNKCYRLAITPKQGVGIVEWGIGGDFPFPEGHVGTMKGLNRANDSICLMLDNKTGRFYRFGLKEIWQDKVNSYGQGTNINTLIRLKEHTGVQGEQDSVEHVESHIHQRPYKESYKSDEEYNDQGFLDDYYVDLKMFANGDTDTPIAKLKKIRQYGDCVFGKRTENKRLQLQIETSTSAFSITRARQLINNINKVAGEDTQGVRTETNYQDDYSSMDLWITRDSKTPLKNRATGNELTGSYDSLIEGADSVTNSGLSLALADTIEAELSQVSQPSTISFWIANYFAAGNIISFETPTDTFYVQIQAGYLIRLTNGAGWTEDVNIEWDGVEWVNITITIDALNFYVYEDGVLRQIIAIPGFFTTYGGAVVVGGFQGEIFDIRRVPKQIGANAISWYYDDVVNNSGDGGLLPMMR